MCFVTTCGRTGCTFLNRKEEEWIEEVDKEREEGVAGEEAGKIGVEM